MLNARNDYIAFFNKALSSCRESRRDVAEEVRIEINKPSSHELYRLIVVDALERKADGTVGVIEFRSDPVDAAYPGLLVKNPVHWSNLTFACRITGFSEEKLVAWGNRWIHDEALPFGAQDGLTGVIHSVTQPMLTERTVEFSVDFGSAPFSAFEELVACFANCIESVGSSLIGEQA